MTFENLCFIEPADIVGVELRCSACDYRWIRTIEKWQNDSMKCANCNADWFLPHSTDLESIKDFVASLRVISALVKRQNGLPFILKFQITCPEQE
jgi:hypothetical protein